MAVKIILDQDVDVYTNLDEISGSVLLNLTREETLTQIVVKLECESKTRLAAPNDDHTRRGAYDTELEVHKLLYQTRKVFPSTQVAVSHAQNLNYTLPPGNHQYPFQFKLPFNNNCMPVNAFIDTFQGPRDTEQHLKRPLPPSLSGFQGEAEIRYYVKVTVHRSAFYKENFRSEVNFKFLPIEPPRSAPNRRESYARRQHQFAPPGAAQRKAVKDASIVPPTISVDGRLPDPAIITLNEPLPLRILVKKLNESSEKIFLKVIQIQLCGYTQVRAHDLRRTEPTGWWIVSKANMNVCLGDSNSPTAKDMEVDGQFWNNVPLPNNVPPSFETCNISRRYELEISVGLAWGSVGDIKPEVSIQTLRMPVQVYSGIRPPPALLEEMAKQQTPAQAGQSLRPPMPVRPSVQSQQSVGQTSSPTTPGTASSAPGPQDLPDVPPPSYEDAMADELAPVDGPSRPRRYEQPEGQPVRDSREKRDSLVGGNNERLFP